MSFFENPDLFRLAGLADRATPARVPTAAFVAPTPVFVDVGASALEANITRGGSKLPFVGLDPSVIGDIIGTIQPRTKLKVLRQSVEAGRAVERGAAVDLVLTDPGGLPLRIVDGVHADLVERTVGEVFADVIQPNAALNQLLAAKTDYVSLSTADKTLIAGALGGSNVDPADDDAVASVFAGFQAARVFGGLTVAAKAIDDLYEEGFLFLNPQVTYGFYLEYAAEPVEAASGEIVSTLDLPVGAIVRSASVEITAEPAGHTLIGNVARVRTAAGEDDVASTQLVIDFGGLRTVSAVRAPTAIVSIKPWLGTRFDGTTLATTAALSSIEGAAVTFVEVATERLLVTLANGIQPADMASAGAVTVTTAPADLEVVVGTERAHFVPGSVKGSGAMAATVDITAAVRTAVASGSQLIPVSLRSSVPSQLSVQPAVDYLKSHQVTFPEGGVRVIDADAEGAVDLVVPLAAGASAWDVRLVTVDLAVDVGDERVVPATGPDAEPDAELICDPDHPLVVRLPPALLRRFDTISGVRILAGVEAAAELAGSFRLGTTDTAGNPVPGDELPKPLLKPTSIDVGPVAWHTLAFDASVAAGNDEDLWVVIQATRGIIRLPLAEDVVPAASDGGAAEENEALVRRQAANGLFRTLPSVAGVSTRSLPLRVEGLAPTTAPIEAVAVSVPGIETEVVRSVVDTDAGQRIEFVADTGVAVAASGAVGDTLVLRLVLHAAASVSVGPIVVGYREGS